MQRLTSQFRKPWLIFILGVFLGALIVLVIRFATTYHVHTTHYHANFAVFIQGRQEKFQDPSYYQEVNACQINGVIKPEQRAHMHDEKYDVLHVHDDGVTWGQFFENLGWYVGPDFIQTRDGTLYKANETNKLHVLLNGQDFTGLAPITNQVIDDRARLLISFGDVSDSTLEQEYKAVPSSAKHYDETPDPASCAGQMDHLTLGGRLKSLL